MKYQTKVLLILALTFFQSCSFDFGEAIDHSSDSSKSQKALSQFLKTRPSDSIGNVHYYSDARGQDTFYLFKFSVSQLHFKRIAKQSMFSTSERKQRIPLPNDVPEWFHIPYTKRLVYYTKEKMMHYHQVLIYDRSASTAYFYYSQM